MNTTSIHNTYVNNTVINNTTIVNNSHTSFNGGANGVAARPTPQQQAFASQPHVQPTAAQTQHAQVAKQDKSNFAWANHGVPARAAVARPATNVAELQHSAVAAKAAPGAKPYVPPPATAAKGGTATSANKAVATPPAIKAAAAAHPSASREPTAKPQTATRPPAAPPVAAKPATVARPSDGSPPAKVATPPPAQSLFRSQSQSLPRRVRSHRRNGRGANDDVFERNCR